VVASGELDAVVVSTGADTFFGRTMALLGAPEERGHLQTASEDGVLLQRQAASNSAQGPASC
jgi:magnesium-transporting ATPase (P-type)